MTHHILALDCARITLDLAVTHRCNLVQIVGNENRLRACVSLVVLRNYPDFITFS